MWWHRETSQGQEVERQQAARAAEAWTGYMTEIVTQGWPAAAGWLRTITSCYLTLSSSQFLHTHHFLPLLCLQSTYSMQSVVDSEGWLPFYGYLSLLWRRNSCITQWTAKLGWIKSWKMRWNVLVSFAGDIVIVIMWYVIQYTIYIYIYDVPLYRWFL